MVYIGLGYLASGQNYRFKEKLLDEEILNKTLTTFKQAAKTLKENDVQLDLALNLASILDSLPKLNFVLKRDDLEFIVNFFKSIFDDRTIKFTVGSKNDNNLWDFYRKSQILRCFANLFYEWQIDSEVICENIWSSWFVYAKDVLKLNLDKEFPTVPAAKNINQSLIEVILFI